MRSLRAFGLVAALFGAPAAPAVELYVSHEYGEFVDRGNVRASLNPSDSSSRIDCATPLRVERNANVIVVSARKTGATSSCPVVATTDVGVLPVGSYTIAARLFSADGATFEQEIETVTILPIEGRCNADPQLSPSILAVPNGMPPAAFAARLASDRSLAARLGNPTVVSQDGFPPSTYVSLAYPPLVDPTVEMDRLRTSGEFAQVSRNAYACFSAPPPDAAATFIEFYNAALDHFFYSGNDGEIAAVDAGRVGLWTRTGKLFRALTAPGCILSTPATIVYRFFGVPGRGPSSHFFTRDRSECHAVDASGQWSLEGIPFWASAPSADGVCGRANEAALYRVWKPFGDSNHRFTTERAVVSEMVSKGWVDEGLAMCVMR